VDRDHRDGLWTGDLVHVDMHCTDYGVRACWLHVEDVRQRRA
jgi:hypothetical protein